jgi:hypothetical protein|tara:strand:- start:120 stop:263 length:144 start_codon:yes stop_codon:yes gene_type:complete
MDLKNLNEKWQEGCPEEANGLVSKRKTPKRWIMKIKARESREKLRRS